MGNPRVKKDQNQLIMYFKIVHDLIDIPADKFLIPASTRTRSGHSLKYRHIFTSSDYYKHFFFPQSVGLCNSIPAIVTEAASLVHFKRELSKLSF